MRHDLPCHLTYLFHVVTEMGVDAKHGNTRAQQRLEEDDSKPARKPEKERGQIKGRQGRAQRSQGQQPFTNGLNQQGLRPRYAENRTWVKYV